MLGARCTTVENKAHKTNNPWDKQMLVAGMWAVIGG